MTDFATGIFKCGCGNDSFVSYPQTMNVGAVRYAIELTCTKCGRTTVLNLISMDNARRKAYDNDPSGYDELIEAYHSTDMTDSEYLTRLLDIAEE